MKKLWPPKDALSAFVVSLICACLLFFPGRLGSTDAGDQYQAALYLVEHGQFGAPIPPGGFSTETFAGKPMAEHYWWIAPNGLYYQTHEVGDTVLIAPIALGMRLLHPGAANLAESPPVVGKVAISLLFCGVVAATGVVLFVVMRQLMAPRLALALAAAFPVATYLAAGSKLVSDTVPSGLMIAVILALFLRAQTRGFSRSALVPLGIACGVLGWFRYTLGIATFVILAVYLAATFRRESVMRLVTLGVAFVAAIAPELVYNYIRTGSPLRPGTLIPRYIGAIGPFTGNPLHGLYGLLISPARGLIWYSPCLLLVGGLPRIWRRLDARARGTVVVALTICVIHTLAICTISAWSGYISWGPRYLMPVLPALYLVAALCLQRLALPVRLWAPLWAVSILANVPASLLDWQGVMADSTIARNQDAPGFAVQTAVWRRLWEHVAGMTPRTDYFPDFFIFRVLERGLPFKLLGMIYIVSLGLLGIWSFRRALSLTPAATPEPQSSKQPAI